MLIFEDWGVVYIEETRFLLQQTHFIFFFISDKMERVDEGSSREVRLEGKNEDEENGSCDVTKLFIPSHKSHFVRSQHWFTTHTE